MPLDLSVDKYWDQRQFSIPYTQAAAGMRKRGLTLTGTADALR
jgi:hypothetical protein